MDRAIEFRLDIPTSEYKNLVFEYLESRGLIKGINYSQPSPGIFEDVRLPEIKKYERRFADIYIGEEEILVAYYICNDAVEERDRVAEDFMDFLLEKGIKLK